MKEAVPLISNAMLIGDKRKFLSMLLTIKVKIETLSPENRGGSPLLLCILIMSGADGSVCSCS